jgi:2,3-bisphosphoglycerate-independent phosphoglycerate mutase
VEVFVEPVKEYRFLLVLRGEGLSSRVAETDPQRTGVAPRSPRALDAAAEATATALGSFLDQARRLLADEPKANMCLLRGFSQRPSWPSLPDIYGMRAAAAAAYPMYRGAARLVGMEVLDAGDSFDTELDAVARSWADFDFFFVHFKKTDSAGEDGDFDRKVQMIESVDAAIPRLLELQPDVLAVTGDHSTPSQLKSHSWHPVPLLLWAPATCRPDEVSRFGERPCMAGGLGPRMPATDLMPLLMAHAGRLEKFGA